MRHSSKQKNSHGKAKNCIAATSLTNVTARAELKVRQLFNRLFSHQNETHETYQQWSPDCFVGTVYFLEFVIWLNESSFFRLSILFLSVYYALVCVFAAILVQLDKKTKGRCGLNADQFGIQFMRRTDGNMMGSPKLSSKKRFSRSSSCSD